MNSIMKDFFETNDIDINLIYKFLESCKNVEKIIQFSRKSILTANLSSGMDGINQLFGEFEILLKYLYSINEISEFKFDLDNIFKKFALLEDAMKTPDYVLICDILKYEIEVIVEKWKEEVTKAFKIYRN